MGKRLISQRRGRGTPTHRSASHRFKGKIEYRSYDNIEKEGSLKGKIADIIHDPGRFTIFTKSAIEKLGELFQ